MKYRERVSNQEGKIKCKARISWHSETGEMKYIVKISSHFVNRGDKRHVKDRVLKAEENKIKCRNNSFRSLKT